jgi:AraC-like DNA-binding protein
LVETAETNLTEKNNTKEEYVKKALEYITMNYSRSISVAEIARNVGLDRSYLYSLFNIFVNASPQEYLINFRMEKACDLMRTATLTIGGIARSVGYDDPLMFSKAFKKVKGLSPREYRKTLE